MSERDTAYDKIDRYLRNNLDDADYADYSAALDLVYGDASAQPAPGQAPIAHLRAMSSTEQWSSWEVCPPDDGNDQPRTPPATRRSPGANRSSGAYERGLSQGSLRADEPDCAATQVQTDGVLRATEDLGKEVVGLIDRGVHPAKPTDQVRPSKVSKTIPRHRRLGSAGGAMPASGNWTL